MQMEVKPSIIKGEVSVPPSKSHTIRSIIFGTLAEGKTIINNPLLSSDGLAPIQGCLQLGASIYWADEIKKELVIEGTGGKLTIPSDVINVQNSGTTLYFLAGISSLLKESTVITGDHSINSRPVLPLIKALNNLGAKCYTTRSTGTPPVIIKGPLSKSKTQVSGISSQFTSSLLIATPSATQSTEIIPINLQEKPYVQMTLDYLKIVNANVSYEKDFSRFLIPGSQVYQSFKKTIPGDFSSAAFLIGASVLAGEEVKIIGLDFKDSQADKSLINILRQMGAKIEVTNNIVIASKADLQGGIIDLSQSPDLVPILAVIATQAEGQTVITKVEHVRIKETNRLAIMCKELKKLGAKIQETSDGLLIDKSTLKGTQVSGHNDHRVVMALAIAGLFAKGRTIVETADAIKVTFPGFITTMQNLNAEIKTS